MGDELIVWNDADVSAFDPQRTDKIKILEDKTWVPCRLCRQIFWRIRLTGRYCHICERGFCEGEHGSFAGREMAVCVRCYKAAGDVS